MGTRPTDMLATSIVGHTWVISPINNTIILPHGIIISKTIASTLIEFNIHGFTTIALKLLWDAL